MYLQNFLSRILSFFPKTAGRSLRQEFRHAFSTGTSHDCKTLNEKERALIMKMVVVIRKRKLSVPASLFLECAQPLNFVGSQMMVFLKPLLTFFFSPSEYDLLQGILEKRNGIGMIIEKLEKADTHRRDAKSAEEN